MTGITQFFFDIVSAKRYVLVFCFSIIFSFANRAELVTVFSDNFDRSSFGTTGGTPAMTWTVTGAGIVNMQSAPSPAKALQLYNTNTVVNTGTSGRTYITGLLSVFESAYKAKLKENVADVIWTFNMRASGSLNTGVTSFEAGNSNYMSAVVLVSTSSDLLSSNAQGYAVILKKGTLNRSARLVRFNGGLGSDANITEIIASEIETANYESIKVVYSPSTDTWQLYARDDDSSTNPLDPSTGILTQAGIGVVDNTYTSTPMTSCGFFYNHGISIVNTSAKASFDNFKVCINIQIITKKIFPTDDTYVYGRGGAEPDIIRGLDDQSYLKTYFHASQSWAHETYLKFDLSSINSDVDLIEKVKLKLYGNDNYGSTHTIQLFRMSGSVWDEDNLTYGTIINVGSKTKLTSMTATMSTTEAWYEWDITNTIKSLKSSGENTLCLMLCDSLNIKQSNGTTSVIASFHSRENTSGNSPLLETTEKSYGDLLLKEILLDGTLLQNFETSTFEYQVQLPTNTSHIPEITAVAMADEATVNVVQAVSLTGNLVERTGTITIAKGGQSIEYTVVFEIAPLNNNTTISNLLVDEKQIEFFSSSKFNYTCYLPYSYNLEQLPVVKFEANNSNQQISVIPASNLTGSATERTTVVRVVSGDLSATQDYNITFEVLPELHLYFCIGQSNMSGRGYMDESLGDLNPVDETYLFTPALGWEIASNPLNKYSSRRKELSMQRISPAYGFAINIKNKTTSPVGLIVNAMGGSSMAQWTKGNAEGLYEAALLRAKEAQKWGKIKAILWHQGESNSGTSSVAAYPNQLKAMVDNYRIDLNEPNLYFIAGELAYWRGEGTGSTAFNEMIRTISSFIDNSDYVSAANLTPLINESDPHFDRASNIELGKRYAEKVTRKFYDVAAETQVQSTLCQIKIHTNKKKVIIENNAENVLVNIIDITGKVIVNQIFNGDFQLDIPNTGIYIVSLSGANFGICRNKISIY